MISLPADIQFLRLKSPQAAPRRPDGEDVALVLGATAREGRPAPIPGWAAPKDLSSAFDALKGVASFTGKPGEIASLIDRATTIENLVGYRHLVGLGVGTPKDFHAQNLLGWAGALGRELRRAKFLKADIHVDTIFNPAASVNADDAPVDFAKRPLPGGIPSREEFLELFALGLYLGLYTFTKFKGAAAKKPDAKSKKTAPGEDILQVRLLSAFLDEKKAEALLERARVVAEGVSLTRDLQTTPANHLVPAELAHQAQLAGRAAGFAVNVWDEKKLKAENMNGILAVGQGSVNPPRLILMEHNAGKKNLPTIVLIGKGITFDTGGISLKPAPGMEDMKMDMSGAASVIGALYAISQLKLPVHVVGLLASAENMPGGRAVKPGDVYTAHNGATVEVINTDAEGRLVLSDALSYAKTYKPDCVIDIATLTGAVIVALGYISSGIMGNDGALLEGFRRASEKIGEKVWELPLYPEYIDDMKSKCADYRNSGDRSAGSQKGGTFLNFFVDGAYPWLHVDIAGTDVPKGMGAHCPPDVGSGVPVRALVEFARNYESYFQSPGARAGFSSRTSKLSKRKS